MKANIKNNIKAIIIVLIMLLIASCVYYGLIQQIVIARSSAEVTGVSKTRPTDDKNWQERQQKDTESQVDGAQGNRTRVRDPKNKFDQSNPKLRELFSKIHPEQVRDDGVYVASSDLREIPSLLCSALGVTLPDWSNTYVTTYDHVLGGYVHANVTDQGKKTAYLTPADLKRVPASALNRTWIRNILDSQVWGTDEEGNRVLEDGSLITDERGDNGENVRDIATGDYCTVFLTDWTEWGAEPIKRFDDPVYSKTLAKFSNITEHKATPAEAWVLAEFDKNDEPDLTVIESNREYNGVPEGIYANIGGKQIIITGDGDIGTEQFIEYKNGKYYYVDIEGEGAEYYPYTYVQHAWWKVKTKGNDKQSNMVETDLAKEAEAFEAYIKEVTGQSNVESLERDENGLFKVDYQVDFTSDAKTRFNAETNKYIIGPFTLDYLRCATKQGERDKVSFCGISNSLIIGTDADGNELLDEEGNSRLKLDENYRFVYDDPEAHKKNRNEWDRDKEDEDCTDELYYPYPAPNEEFYIEIDYLDDLSLIKNIKFNFQYMTSGGEYEFCDGTFLRIKWVFNWDMDMETRPGASSDGNTVANVSSEANGNFVTARPDINIDVVGATWSGGQPWTPPTGGPGGGPTITHTPGNYTFTGYDPNDTLHWYRFRYWLEPETYVSNTAQSLINVFALHLVVDIDEVELEIIPDDPWIDLRTSMGGFVWIDKDEQKDQSASGTLGIYEEGIDKRAPKNSVEVIVWKVTYDANGNEIEREKALGWMDDGDAGSGNGTGVKDNQWTQNWTNGGNKGNNTGSGNNNNGGNSNNTGNNNNNNNSNNGGNNNNNGGNDSNNQVYYYISGCDIENLLTQDSTESSADDLSLLLNTGYYEDKKVRLVVQGDAGVGNNVYYDSRFDFVSAKSNNSRVKTNIRTMYDVYNELEPEQYKELNAQCPGYGGYRRCIDIEIEPDFTKTGRVEEDVVIDVVFDSADAGLSRKQAQIKFKLIYEVKSTTEKISRSNKNALDNGTSFGETIDIPSFRSGNIFDDSRTVAISNRAGETSGNGQNSEGSATKIDFKENRLYIDDKGEYFIPKIQVPSKEGKEEGTIIAYDVEFIYDGQTYETTEYLKSTGVDDVAGKLEAFKKTPEETAGEAKDYEDYKNDSYVVENADERKEFDSYFTEVKGRDPISGGETTGETAGGPTGFYYEDEDGDGKSTGEDELKYKKAENSEYALDFMNDLVNEVEGKKTISTLITHDEDGYILKKYRFASRTSEAGLLLPYETKYHNVKDENGEDLLDNIYFQEEAYKPINEYFKQINMGLLERYHSDASMLKDLYSAKIIVNNQESPTYTFNELKFNSLGELKEEALHQQIDSGYREQTYKIDLYNSDYNYRSSVYDTIEDTITKQVIQAVKEKTELRMFVTYRLAIRNESVLTDMSINEFKDYYDKTFTLIDKDLEVNVEATDEEQGGHGPGTQVYPKKVVARAPYYRKLSADGSASDYSTLYMWNKDEDLKAPGIDDGVIGDITFEEINSGSSEFKGSVSGSLRGVNGESVDDRMLLEPGETFEIFITYEVDREGFEEVSNDGNGNRDDSLLGEKNNIAEITNYSTVYTDEAVARHKTTSYEAGQVSGRIDQDSAPDNINMANVSDTKAVQEWEDDTEAAPTLTTSVKEPVDRKLDGVVWEDSKIVTDNSADGNGIFDSGEEGIQGIDVTLLEKIRVTAADLADKNGTVANLDMLDYEFEFVWPDGALAGLNSKAVTGAGGTYEFENFVSGNYAVRFEYGNNDETLKYNGQDYKMTAYQTNMTNASSKDADDTVNGTSDMLERAGMPTLNNEWHDLSSNSNATALESTRVSDARDYEPRRMKVMAYSRTITNENAEVLAAYINDQADPKMDEAYKVILQNNIDELKKNTAMVANTAKFKVDIEKQDTIAYKTVKTTMGEGNNKKDGVTHEYYIANVDFGLVERPETKMYIKKELGRIDLFKNDGTGLILSVECDEDGNLIKTNGNTGLEGNVHINKISEIEKANLALGIQGFKYVAIESTFLAGMDVNLAYKMTVYNDSETDYVGVDLSEMKNVQRLYDKVVDYETKEGDDGLIPFNTGKDIQYGKYVGLHYYTNKTDNTSGQNYAGKTYRPEVVVTTTVDQIVDYIDNDISLNLEETQNVEDQSWTMTSDIDREHKLSTVSYSENTRSDDKLVDNKGRKYIGNTSRNNIAMSDNELVELASEVKYVNTKTYKQNGRDVPLTKSEGGVLKPQTEDVILTNVYSAKENISSNQISMYNPGLTRELKPGETASIMIATSAHANAEDAKSMNYDNLAEIVMYSNTVGRRDMQAIPGNANMIAKQNPAWQAGYTIDYQRKYADNSREDIPYFVPNTNIAVGNDTVETERDAFAARDTVTFSEPTGLSMVRENIDRTVRIILLSLIAAAIVVVTIIILINLKKKTYDDKGLFERK